MAQVKHEEAGVAMQTPAPVSRLRALDVAAVAGLTGLALWLRVWGNGFGLPAMFGGDEWATMDNVLAPGLAMHRFMYGPVLPYLLKVALGVYWAMGAVGGRFHTWAGLQAAVARDPTAVYLIGRSVCGGLSALTVLLVAVYGRRWYGRLAGYGGALLLAVNVTHVRESHFIGTDVPMTLLITIAVGYAVAAWDQPTRRRLDALAALFGCAISVKCTALLAATMPLLVHWRRRLAGGWRAFAADRGLWRSVGIAAAVVIAIFWSALLRPAAFVHDAGSMAVKSFSGHLGNEEGLLAWLFAPSKSLAAEWGWPGLVLAPLAIWGAFRRRQAADVMLLAVGVPVLLVCGLASVKIMRYVIPALPALALLTGAWLSAALRGAGRWRVPAFAVALAGVAVSPLYMSVLGDREFTGPDTRLMAAAWMTRHLRPGSRVLMDRSHGPYCPPLDEKRFEVLWLPSLSARLLFRDQPPERLTLRDYPSAEYAVLSSDACDRYYMPGTRAKHPRIAAAYRRLFAEIRADPRIARFDPVHGRIQGPLIEIFDLPRPAPTQAGRRWGRDGRPDTPVGPRRDRSVPPTESGDKPPQSKGGGLGTARPTAPSPHPLPERERSLGPP